MKSRLVSIALLILGTSLSQASGWDMAGRDPAHTNTTPVGPYAPLTQAWVARSEDPESSFTNWPVVSEGSVYARSAGGVIAVDAITGTKRWWKDFGGSNQVAPAVDRKAVYLPLGSGELVAVDRLTGELLWAFNHPSERDLEGSPTLVDGRLYFGLAEANSVLAVNAEDGKTLWEVATELQPDSVPAVADGVMVLPTDQVGGPGRADRVVMLALEVETGKELWRLEEKESSSSASIAGGQVFFGGGDFQAYALDLQTGKKIWTSKVEDKFGPWNMPALAFGDVFLADRIGNIYRLDGATGNRKWIARDTVGTMDQSFPVIAGKTLFIGSGAGELYAFDVDSGRLLWKDGLRGIVHSGAVDDRHFYFGVKLGKDEGLYAYKNDPSGELVTPPLRRNPLGALFGGLLLFVVLLAAVIIFSRHRAERA